MAGATEKLAIFMYFDADDENLESSICQNVLDITAASLSEELEIYVYLDRLGKDTRDGVGTDHFDDVYDNWIQGGEVVGGSMYGKVVKQGEKFVVDWDTTVGLQVRDSSLSSTLGDFLTWATGQTTANHYVVWMSDHGNGIAGGFYDASIAENSMLPKQYAAALKPYADKLDVVTFDACLMANAEALRELSGIAKYAVSSEEVINDKGYDYTTVFNNLSLLASREARDIAQTIVNGNVTRSDIYTLSSVKLDDSIIAALQNFGTASAGFTEADWSAVIDAFHNPRYYYMGTYADIVELMKDSALTQDHISQTLKDAAAALKAAVLAAVDCRKQPDVNNCTEHGYGVMVYAPVRQIEMIPCDFACLSMTQAGNDTPWSDFLYRLYQKAKAVDKVTRTMPDGALENQYSAPGNINIGYPLDETGVSQITDVEMINLTDNGLIHRGNYDINQECWLAFQYSAADIAAEDTYNMTFTFSPYLNTTEIAANSIIINAYQVTINAETKTVTLVKPPFKTFTNTAGNTITVDVPSGTYQDQTIYVWQIVSEKAVSFTFEGDHTKAGVAVMATQDRFDRIETKPGDTPEYGYHAIDNALNISTNYVSALAVTKNTEKNTNEDWFTWSDVAQTVEVIAGSTSAGAISAGALVVQLCQSDGTESGYTVKATAGEDPAQTGKYVFSDVTYELGDCLRVSTTGAAACYYEVMYTAETTSKPEEYTAPYLKGYIDSTSVSEISGKDGSSALYWSIGHGVRTLSGVTYKLQLSSDGFATKTDFTVGNDAAKIYGVNSGATYNWRVKTQLNGKDIEGGADWAVSAEAITGGTVTAPQCVVAQNDFVDDFLMARANGIWSAGYRARHVGFSGSSWTGTREVAAISGKNKITDVFVGGGTDSATLVLTDDAQGDAAFVDDIYSALPSGASGSRLTGITRVYAGEGSDVVDFTSQTFTNGLVGASDQMRLYGGNGDDILWSSDTASWVFGDDGNDQLAGSSKDDVLVGGNGNDTLYGCGGNDVFCFCANWGTDVVHQLDGGTVTLWFQTGVSGSWDATNLVYTAGDNTVTVKGVAAADITVWVGDIQEKTRYDELSGAYAFSGHATTKIFS